MNTSGGDSSGIPGMGGCSPMILMAVLFVGLGFGLGYWVA